MNTTYCGVPPSRKKNGRGVNLDAGRTLAQWKQALEGHRLSAHKGAILNTCAGCMDLLARIDGAQ